ncbi:ATP-dependent DNA ligase [Streptomyces sp. SID4919]|uniref:non-homologous end-joining DNA ligase n=1 Tax=unclassified Streptomyces TaxID=2593676 RepID=UPI000823EC44|nr:MULTISPECIES: non-homologous end-joining DNA ligase [unclassified Streptomyces]MYY09244.1 ATP-dependent DNA ligase [Streptomyces sp. SID4919]SCK42086.1 bifunctional non-homologous end joining protein LigD [Streptomyces sp. AmelKG-E11A]
MSGLLGSLPPEQVRLLSVARPGRELAARPMTATLSDRREFSARWIFERKLDGVRMLAVREAGTVTLVSRSGRRVDGSYPEIAAALAAQERADFTVDGEIVAFTHGRTDFGLLQRRMGLTRAAEVAASGVAVTYCVFDVLRLDGADTTGLPLRTRKSLLRRALTYRTPLRFTPHRNAGGTDLLAQACARGWEGLIAKRADSRYQPRRSPDWLKLKCSRGQEFVIGGFTEPAGGRTGFGALLLGHYADGVLRYAGKVGTGFPSRTLTVLRTRLDGLRRPDSPFGDRVTERHPRWVEPSLVAQVEFAEWTRDGMLRHPRFIGLRDDKRPQDVVREEAGPPP